MAAPIVKKALQQLMVRRQVLISHSFRRFSTNTEPETVRVRFAPSPTGFLHLGGLRTALFNYLFARSRRGRFILRIEDTDRTRIVPGAVERLEETLGWAGIIPDEGPSQGGSFGPYTQSERLEIYNEKVKLLLDNGSAYPCFCTSRRLELMRKDAARKGEPSKYDNRCRNLTPDQMEEFLSKNMPFVIRLKLEPTTDPWPDLVKGPTMHNIADIEGDPIILKSDGYPTYHLANVVDDHLMEITHVLRGSEWLSSTPKHILLYKSFGWTPPLFGHLPLIVNADGSKLSKRQGDIHVEHFKEAGYFPEAVLNYITSIGGGFTQPTQGMPLASMCNQFDLDAVRAKPARLDSTWLNEANRDLINSKLRNVDESTKMVEELRQLVEAAYGNQLQEGSGKDDILSGEYLLNIIRWSLIDERIVVLKDLVKSGFDYLWVTPGQSHLPPLIAMDANAIALISSLLSYLRDLSDFTTENLAKEMKSFAKSQNVTTKKLFPFMRTALTGMKQGPPLTEMMSVIGKKNVLTRLKRVHQGLSQLQF